MSKEGEKLRERLYMPHEAHKKSHILRPKNPGQISPSLRQRTRKNDQNPEIPPILLPSETSQSQNRPHTSFSDYRSSRYGEIKSSTVQTPKTPVSFSQNDDYEYRPNSISNTVTNTIARPRTSLTTPISPIRTAKPRSRAPTFVPNEKSIYSEPKSPIQRPNTAFAQKPGSSPFLTQGTTTTYQPSYETTNLPPEAEILPIPEPIFRLKKSNLLLQNDDDFEQFKFDPIYTKDISDDLWNNQHLIFYYIRLIRQKCLNQEFLYFYSMPATSREPENCYFLRITSPHDIDIQHPKCDYYTLSADGVTSYQEGHKCEFVSLEQWIRECVIFLKSKKIKFFAQFDMWRSFMLLQSITRSHLISTSRHSMSNSLFAVDSILRTAILGLQRVCDEIRKLSLVDCKSSQTLTLRQFLDRQVKHEAEIKEELNKLLEKARIGIVHACDLTYESTGTTQSEARKLEKKREEAQSPTKKARKEKLSERLRPPTKPKFQGKGADFPKRMSTQPKKKKTLSSNEMMVYTQLATQKFCYKRLSRFIRLCDYMLIHTLNSFVVASCKTLVDFLEPRGNSSGGDATRLSTEMIVIDDHLGFSPSRNEMISSITRIWKCLVSTIEAIPTFSVHQSLIQYAKSYGWAEPAVPLTQIMKKDVQYQSLLQEMLNRLNMAFSMATEKIQSYNPFLEAYIRNINFDVHKVQLDDPPASFYSESLDQYRSEIKKMDSLEHSTQVHMLLIQLNSFCDMIRPSPRRCLEQLNVLIPCIAENKVDKITSKVTDALSTLHNDPQDIHVFVSQLEFRKKLTGELDTIRNDYKDASDFYALIDKNSITTTEDAVGSFRSLSNIITMLEPLVIQMNEEEESKIKKWSPNLNSLLVKLRKDILDLQVATTREDVMSSEGFPLEPIIQFLKNRQDELQELKERAETVQRYQRVLQLKVSPIDELTEVTSNLNLKYLLWTSYKEWKEKVAQWKPTPFKTINSEQFGEDLAKFVRITTQLTSGLGDHPLTPIFKQNVQSFNSILPAIVAMSSPYLNSTHWTKIENITGLTKLEDTNYPLSYLIDKQISSFVEPIESVANDAANEATLRKMLKDIEAAWDTIELNMVLHKDLKEFYLVGDLEEIIAHLEESQVQLSTIRSSRFVGAIKPQVDDLSRSMNLLAKCLDDITTFQIAFNSLTKVFSSGDIQQQLSSQTAELNGIERQYKLWTSNAHDMPKCFKLCANHKAVEMFEDWIAKTENIQKALEEFLQRKRTAFPRFYFLSNENLLKIFAEARNPKAVNPFLPKLFDGIHTLEFSSNGQDIISMSSVEGENILLTHCQSIGAIEAWMTNLERCMKLSLHRVLKEGKQEFYSMNRKDWLSKYPAQVITVYSQVNFSLMVEDALSAPKISDALKDLRDLMESNLSDLADIVRLPLSRALRSGIVSLITLEVHSRDIVSELMAAECTGVADFEWVKRLRYYWDVEANRVKICQANATIMYGYEYLGATSRLVVTPLTERCYLTLTSALQFFLGGSPAGPAGTGKTETVKDLAKSVGNFCVVFNCSDAVTVIQMESFFSGLAQTGAWACFDEFNRINSEVLSVIAEQVYTVQQAVASGLQTFQFVGQTIPLNPRCGVFITMNPGYAGRTELPDNLKSLFRPISMMVPDYAMIAEVVLYSEGFNTAKPLAKKVTQLYKLSSEMLSQQSHYDFGMRALKSVLVMAGASKRRSPDLSEDIILIRAMRDSNISKLLIDDAKLFDAIIGDLFPGVEFENESFDELTKAITKAIENRNLQLSDFMIMKTIQLYQTIYIRHGVMLVGPTGGGKTTSRNLLADSIDILGTKVEQKEINPKAVTLTDLYGAYNLVTGDWKNGLVGKMFSEMAEADKEIQQWIIFDGPVDALWIENMNTVLDDNKLLSLANSDRIKMTDMMHLLFEVGDLAQASPATVSRCGMVYYQPEDLGWRPLVNGWIASKPENIQELLHNTFETTFDQAVETMNETCKTVVTPLIWNIATSLCTLFDAITSSQEVVYEKLPADQIEKIITTIYAFAMAWAFGGVITEETRGDFDTFVREMFERKINYPPRKTLFDYQLDIKEMKFDPWSDLVNTVQTSSIVPTADTIRFSNLLQLLIEQKRPVLFLGESGCGKTSIIQNTLQTMMQTISSILFTLSARTSAAQIQDLIEAKMLQKRKTLYGPPEGKSSVLVIDDFNMPRPDTYWSQPPIEILRTIINNKGLYNRDELFWYDIEDLTLVGAGITQGHVTPRFTSRFTILALPAPSDPVLIRIFSEILNEFLNGFVESVIKMSDLVVKSSVTFYRKIKAELLPTPSRSHYTFNLRDLSRVFKGILLTNKNSLCDPTTFVKLWFHENLRVFGDRLVDDKDRALMLNTMFEVAKNSYKLKEEMSFYFNDENPLAWTDILKGYGDSTEKSYQEVSSYKQMTAALRSFSDMYKTPVVLFKEAIEHTLRIVRVMRQPSGHMLLVGMGGTGKRTSARFAAFVSEIEIFEPQPAKEYKLADFRNDLKILFKAAGVQNRKMMFLLTDEQIVDESFLEDINNVLNTGDVPGLFETEEFDQMINDLLVPQMKKAGESLAYDSLCRKFTSNIMKNLHVVLALSPVGGRFRDRCRIFPSLVSCCTIDWFEPWPSEALHTVAHEFLEKMDLSRFGDVKPTLAEVARFAHTLVCDEATNFQNELSRVYYVTPAVYIEFFNLFTSMLAKRTSDHDAKKQQLEKGVEKLTETNQKVQEMEAELQGLRPMLQKKAVETNLLMDKLKVDREKVNEAHRQISSEEEVVKQVRQEAMVLAKDAQDDLDRALPLLQAALSAVEDLKNRKADLAVVKTFTKPPQLVVEVMEAVCLLMGKSPDWSTAKQLLAQTDFFNRLLDVHNNPIPEATLIRIRQMANDPRFELKKVIGVSESAACLFKWVTAIEKYVTESVRIEPKKKRRDEAQATLDEAEKKLKAKQDELHVISSQLASLQKQYEDSCNQQKELAQKIEQCEYRLKNASQLTSALDSERVRWTDNLSELSIKEKCLLGDTLLIALHVAYIGPFSFPYRQKIISKLINKCNLSGIEITPDFNLENVATSPITLREWQVCGLPQDALSRQNGVLVTSTRRWPLLIDPQGQGRKWLIETGNIQVIRCTDNNYTRVIENAIFAGSMVLVEDVEETLDSGLQFIIAPKTRKQGGRLEISVGEKWIAYHPQFKLYLTTKLNNPQYLPDVFIQLSVINFSVTHEGLEEQLLSDVVLHEMPELEKQRSELIVSIAKDQKALSDLMAQILHLLFTSKGNILDNEQLIKTLHDAKATSTQVSERLVEAEKTEKEITEKREVYRNVATRGSVLYFVVLELPGIDSMYQYSLEFFKRIFKGVLDSTERCDDDIAQQCELFIDGLTFAVFANVSRGLFANHREVFSFLIATALERSTNEITDDMWKLFLRGPSDVDISKFDDPNPNIEERIWAKCCALSKAAPDFNLIQKHINENYNLWKDFIEESSIEIPLPYSKLSTFNKLIIASCISRRKIVTLARSLVREVLGENFIAQADVDLNAPYQDTSKDTPLLFILSQGADPRDSLERLAAKKGFAKKLSILSLGQGRGPAASKLIKKAKLSGHWVFLQNCHLCPSFLPALEQKIQKMSRNQNKISNQFRLILSSMPTDVFPVSILRNSVKVTSEPPSGIQPNVQLLLNTISSEQWESCSKIKPWKKLLFGIALFHATIQERKRYGALGFNKTYEWNTSDFSIATKILHAYLTQNDQTPWDALRQMIGDVVYGGRVTDDWDRRCMNAILDRFLCPRVLNDGIYFDYDKKYPQINVCSYEQIFEQVQKFPIEDSPSIFGFHPVALNAIQLFQSNQIVNWIIGVQPNESSGSAAQKDDDTVLVTAEELGSQLPREIITKNANPTLFEEHGDRPNSLTVVLMQEVERYNKLISVIQGSLTAVSQAIRGEVVMSIDILEVYRSLLNKQVPKAWSEVAYPSVKPLASWFKDLLERIEFIQNWLRKGEPNVFWFPGFFFPQAFLTAVLQNHSRKYSVPIDKLRFEAKIMDEDADALVHPAADGTYIHGLYFDGARWDKSIRTLEDTDTNAVYTSCPVIHIIPKENFLHPSEDYKCPVYRTSERAGVLSTTGLSTNFVVALNIPTNDEPNKWTLRGTALLLSTPY
ncbi:Dynein heavy chain family protein [Tritrichomonas foetus]|uniref:Dynein heavy chain family protein n=1 Tax=Tritrichomonas foetus TaxID=1144522 RepID=A0A1J4JRX0_9EUKA|nr:Dynein heavy chain family protein [Tritrichomonas foetus]|eukprot:OHT01787.1 Dynein heavy chain family protein [Tritrichomonas foetus]